MAVAACAQAEGILYAAATAAEAADPLYELFAKDPAKMVSP